MIPGRRVLLSAGFLGLAVLLTMGPARAQDRDRSSHRLWQNNLTPDQIREALAKMGAGEFGDLNPFEDMVKDYLQKNNPGLDPKTAEEALKKITGDKQLMESLKQFAKQRQTDPGRPGKLTPEDLAKLFNTKNGELPKLPPEFKGFGDPKNFDPKLIDPKNFDPKLFDPKNFDPKNFDPKLFDPKLIDPKLGQNPKVVPDPKAVPPDPKVGQPMPPVPPDPVGGEQPPPDPKDTVSLDKNPFPEPEEANDPRSKSLEAFASIWERNIGPLSETPEVQRALFDLVGENGFDFDMKDDKGNSLWDLLRKGDSDGSGFGDLLKDGAGGGSGWNFSNWEFPKVGDWFRSNRSSSSSSGSGSSWWNSRSSSSPRSSPSSSWGSGGGPDLGGLGGMWLPFVILLVVIVGVFLWFQLKDLRGRSAVPAFAGEGIGPWPVDPRAINTREDVVKAFEYLSVLICGPSARNWTHSTIAGALADLAVTHGETATMLARLYELARYAPLDEPLTRDELIEARRLVCSLAGVSY